MRCRLLRDIEPVADTHFLADRCRPLPQNLFSRHVHCFVVRSGLVSILIP